MRLARKLARLVTLPLLCAADWCLGLVATLFPVRDGEDDPWRLW